MPGIAGIITRRRHEGLEAELGIMVESMRHQRYYVGNRYINHDVGLYAGWLSHPGSLGERMPLVSEDKSMVLVIVGEHFPNIRSGNPEGGNGITGEELVRLYQECPSKMLNLFNGWFSGFGLDLKTGTITLFNDRYGMGRVYIHQGEEEFLFSSEAKSLLRIRRSLRNIEPGSLAEYLRFNCVLQNRTLFQGISLLPGAASWTFNKSSVPRQDSYFEFTEWEEQPALKPDEFYQRFEETISRVLPMYFDAAHGVGFSLTAGLDTRAILAAVENPTRAFPCYTFGGLWGETFDIRTARRLSEISGLTHEVIRINERFLRDFPHYARQSVYVSDGAHDMLGAHDVYFNQVARDIAPIRLTGKFGSEVVRIRNLIPSGDFPRHLVQNWFSPFLEHVHSFCEISRQSHPLTRVVSQEIPWHEFGRVSVEQSEVILRTPYLDNELVKLMYQAPSTLRASRDLQARYIIAKSPELAKIPTNLGRITYNHELISKATYFPLWALFKIEYIYLFATPHWLTRIDRYLQPLRPETIVAGRQKFEGYRLWLRTHLAEFVRETLLTPRAHFTEFFQKEWVIKIVQRHMAGTHNYLNEINKILTVELMMATLFRDCSETGQSESRALTYASTAAPEC